MKSDQELRKAYKISIEEDNIIYLLILKEEENPEHNVRFAELLKSDIFVILNKNKEQIYNMLVDVSPLGKTGSTTSKTRKLFVQISEHKQLYRTAILGSGIIVRTTTSFIISLAGKGNRMKWFTDKTHAFSWLKG